MHFSLIILAVSVILSTHMSCMADAMAATTAAATAVIVIVVVHAFVAAVVVVLAAVRSYGWKEHSMRRVCPPIGWLSGRILCS